MGQDRRYDGGFGPMTRRSGTSRTSSQAGLGDGPGRTERPYPSLRQRQPVAYWLAIIGVVALVLSTIASFLSVIL